MGERDAVYALFDWENELSIHRTMDGAKAAAQRKADEYDEGYTFAWESDAAARGDPLHRADTAARGLHSR
jgi:hypothetical protein